MLHQREIKK